MEQTATQINYFKYAGIGLGIIVIGVVVYKVTHKLGQTDKKDRIEKEDKKLKGLQVHYGSEGYVNVRSSPKVDNINYVTFDYTHNLLKQVKTNPVGTISERIKGEDGYFWYKIVLTQAINGQEIGYVREDAVNIQLK